LLCGFHNRLRNQKEHPPERQPQAEERQPQPQRQRQSERRQRPPPSAA